MTSGAGNNGADAHGDARPHHETGLLLIALEKLVRGSVLIIVGLAALKLIHKNLGDVLLRVALWLHLDPLGPIVSHLMDRADLVSGRQLRMAGALSLFYAVVALVEGIGLLMHQIWAEYLTLVITTAALPLEIFEIFRHPHWTRYTVFGINLLVFGYLVWLMRRKGLLGTSSPDLR